MTRLLNDGTKEEHVVFISLPTSLMQKFCVLKSPGESVGDLTDAYIDNTLCGRKYEAQVDKQQEYFDSVKKESLERKKDGKSKKL